jgi:hypothetical protein
LTARLAKVGKNKLTEYQMLVLLNSLRDEGGWFNVPNEIIAIGKALGFFRVPLSGSSYVFPSTKCLKSRAFSKHAESKQVIPKFFAHSELDWSNYKISTDSATNLLISNEALLAVFDDTSDTPIFISKKALEMWFCRVNWRLGIAGKAKLTKKEMLRLVNYLRKDGKLDNVPKEVVAFGQAEGYVQPCALADSYVFPLGKIISFLGERERYCAFGWLTSHKHKDLTEDSLIDWFNTAIAENLSGLSDRDVFILKNRLGLAPWGVVKPLDEIGKILKITRERVRQLEAKILKSNAFKSLARQFAEFLVMFVKWQKGSLIIPDTLNVYLKDLVTSVCKIKSVPVEILDKGQLLVLGHRISCLMRQRTSDSTICLAEKAEIETLLSSSDEYALGEQDIAILSPRIADLNKWKLTKEYKVRLALQQIGRPAHYTEVADVYSEMFPEDPSTDHNIHAILGRQVKAIVWIGVKGTFALKEWGYERPKRSLWDEVYRIVYRKYKETGRPVSFSFIACEIGRIRKMVNQNSLTIAVGCNERLIKVGPDLFIPKRRKKKS